jgi:quercetin dioxygenase-like cupin family protein
MNLCRSWWLLALLWVPLLEAAADAPAAGNAPGRNVVQMKFGGMPGLPACAPGAVQSGDPAQGPFVVLGKIATGCTVPWHWHTANEQLMMVSGVARVEMKDAKPFTLRAGGFARLPAQHAHQFHCERACLIYVVADAAFDIHYVNAQGGEIAPAEALKAVGESEAKPTK